MRRELFVIRNTVTGDWVTSSKCHMSKSFDDAAIFNQEKNAIAAARSMSRKLINAPFWTVNGKSCTVTVDEIPGIYPMEYINNYTVSERPKFEVVTCEMITK